MNDHEGRIICSMCAGVWILLGVELTHSASLYQLNDVLGGCRLVKATPKGFTDQRVGRCVVPTLASVDLC
jgi:hypothetical protein